jgi:predicted transcriptional regulator
MDRFAGFNGNPPIVGWEVPMASLTIEVPEVVARRLEALGTLQGQSVGELAREAVESFAGSVASRRAMVKAWRAAAKVGETSYSLAELGWLQGYSGQTVDEILSYEGTDGIHNLLFALEEAIEAKVKAMGPLKITGVERTVRSVMALSREVNNGGYEQFFRNSSRRFAPAIVNDLVRIGCTEIADITQQALDALELPPKLSAEAIEAAMATESVQRKRALERCDVLFYEKGELFERLFAYVKAHQEGIRS